MQYTNPEDNHPHTCHHENLKSHKNKLLSHMYVQNIIKHLLTSKVQNKNLII
jgi:hypothetical protein